MSRAGTEDAVDDDIRRTIWNGTVPVMFTLAPAEVTGTATPRPLFVNIPRSTYFAAKPHETIRDHFAAAVPSSGGELWLEYNSVPLRWHYPVGVLYDLLAEGELPWSIVVHFQNFPSEQVIRLSSSSQTPIRSYYMNSLKESTYVKQNGIKTINDFGIRESDSIWEGLYEGNFEKFWSIASVTSPTSTHIIPVRVLRPNYPIMQFPCATKQADSDSPNTLATTLQHSLQTVPNPSSIVVQGVNPSIDTPIWWLYQHLSHPDGFLYIVIKD